MRPDKPYQIIDGFWVQWLGVAFGFGGGWMFGTGGEVGGITLIALTSNFNSILSINSSCFGTFGLVAISIV